MSEKPNNKIAFYKHWWLWATIIIFILIGISASVNNNASNNTKNNTNNGTVNQNNGEQVELGKKIELVGGILGEYGRVITLNKNTDIPVDKYLYKIPAGEYKVTTSNKKYSAFFIVKDEIGIEEDNNDYPEVLQYVGEQYLLTSSDNDLNGHAKKEVTITIHPDESILLTNGSNYITVQEIIK